MTGVSGTMEAWRDGCNAPRIERRFQMEDGYLVKLGLVMVSGVLGGMSGRSEWPLAWNEPSSPMVAQTALPSNVPSEMVGRGCGRVSGRCARSRRMRSARGRGREANREWNAGRGGRQSRLLAFHVIRWWALPSGFLRTRIRGARSRCCA